MKSDACSAWLGHLFHRAVGFCYFYLNHFCNSNYAHLNMHLFLCVCVSSLHGVMQLKLTWCSIFYLMHLKGHLSRTRFTLIGFARPYAICFMLSNHLASCDSWCFYSFSSKIQSNIIIIDFVYRVCNCKRRIKHTTLHKKDKKKITVQLSHYLSFPFCTWQEYVSSI